MTRNMHAKKPKIVRMKSWMEIVRYVKEAVSVLDFYQWRYVGTLKKFNCELPTSPGVYKVSDGEQDYIGRAIKKGGLRKRIKEHIRKPHKEWRTVGDKGRFKVYVLEMQNDDDGRLWSLIVEAVLIFSEKPTLNRNGKQNTVYLPDDL